MHFKIVKSISFDVRYLDVYFGGRVQPDDILLGDKHYETWSEVMEDYPNLVANMDGRLQFFLRINVETGKVINWADKARTQFRNIKVVDEGTYILKDKCLNDIMTYEGYVPGCLEIDDNGWGDYIEFTINDRYIENWSFGQKDVDEICK